MNSPLSIFAIVKREINGFETQCVFMENTFENAKLWMIGYLKDTPNIKPHEYILYKIGQIDKELKITNFKVYITNGSKLLNPIDITQLKFENWEKIMEKKKEKIRNNEIKKLYENGNMTETEMIKELFNGRIIDDKNK